MEISKSEETTKLSVTDDASETKKIQKILIKVSFNSLYLFLVH